MNLRHHNNSLEDMISMWENVEEIHYSDGKSIQVIIVAEQFTGLLVGFLWDLMGQGNFFFDSKGNLWHKISSVELYCE